MRGGVVNKVLTTQAWIGALLFRYHAGNRWISLENNRGTQK
jgi:hypothetical protein